MKRKYIAILFLLFFLIPTFTFGLKKWTVLVFMNGDNNLEAYGIQDFLEMSSEGSDANIDIVVQFDRIGGYSTLYGNWTDCMRFHITPGLTPIQGNEVMDLGEVNMGSPTVLSDFVNWGIDNYPAEKYLVVIWNHGDGWTRDFSKSIGVFKDCLNDDTSHSSVGVANGELASALSDIYTHLGRKIDLIGFDACLMQMWEVAVEAEPYAAWMIGSEELEGADGWVYSAWLDPLKKANGGYTPAQLGDKIASTFVAQNQPTSSCIDLQQIQALNLKIDEFAKELMKARYLGHGAAIESIINATQRYNLYYGLYPEYDFRDLVDFCERVQGSSLPSNTQTAAGEVLTVLNSLIYSSYYYGASYSGSNGISIYIPTPARYQSNPYSSLTSSNLHWDEFIRGDSMEPGTPEVALNYVSHSIDDSVGGNNDGEVDGNETVDMYISLKNNQGSTLTGISGVLSTSDTYVTINSNSSTYPDVNKFKTTTSNSGYNFTVAKECPASHIINFKLNIATDQGANTETFTVTVVDPAPKEVTLVYDSHSIDDSVGGNNDGEPDGGEFIDMQITLKNTNIDSATNVSATLSTANPYINITTNSANYPDINGSNGTGTSLSSYQFDISQDCPAGEMVTFDLNISADEGTWTDSFTMEVIDKYVPPPIAEVTGGQGLFNPEWSWTGNPRKVAYIQFNPAGNSDIYVVNSDGTLPTKLTDGTEGVSHVSQITWSPDDSKVVFAGGDPLKIFSIASDGSEQGNAKLLMPMGPGGVHYYKWVDPDWASSTNQYGNVERITVSISGDIWVFEPNNDTKDNSGLLRISNLSDPYISQTNIDKLYQPHWNNANTEITFVRRPGVRTNKPADTDIYKVIDIQDIIAGNTHPVGDPDGDGIGGDWSDPRLIKISDSANPEYSPSYSIDGTQISYNRDSANAFNNFTFCTDPVAEVADCNFDAYSSASTMSSYHDPGINEGFMKWSSAGGDLFSFIEETGGVYKLRVIEDATIGGFGRNPSKNAMFIIQDRAFTKLAITSKDAGRFSFFSIKSLHTAPFLRFEKDKMPIGEWREFLADNKPEQLEGAAIIEIRFSKQELKNRTKDELILCRLEGFEWKEVPSIIDISNDHHDGGVIKASISQLGTYGIFSKGIQDKNVAAETTEPRIFPNPCRIYPSNYELLATVGYNAAIFDNIKPSSKEVNIKIYSIAGELIVDSENDVEAFQDVSGEPTTIDKAIQWNLKNKSGEPVAAGVYIVIIKVDGKEYIKKLAIVK